MIEFKQIIGRGTRLYEGKDYFTIQDFENAWQHFPDPQHISATSFWGPDGRPLSAAEFMEALFGKLPDLFKNEDELRALWGDPQTRRALLEQLEHAGFGTEPLHEMARLIEAPETDIFDVLAYVAFALPPITRAERVRHHQPAILSRYNADLQTFITFILGQYVAHGIGELGSDNLSQLLQLRYNSATDAATRLGGIPQVRSAYLTTQHQLFARS